MPAAASERPLAEDRGVMILGKIRLAVGILYSVLFAFNVCASGSFCVARRRRVVAKREGYELTRKCPSSFVFLCGGTGHLTVVSIGVLATYMLLASLEDLNIASVPAWAALRSWHFELTLPLTTCVFLLYTGFAMYKPTLLVNKEELPAGKRGEELANKIVSFKPPFGECWNAHVIWLLLHLDHLGQFLAIFAETAFAPRNFTCNGISGAGKVWLDTIFIFAYFAWNTLRWSIVGVPCYPVQELWRKNGHLGKAYVALASVCLSIAQVARTVRWTSFCLEG